VAVDLFKRFRPNASQGYNRQPAIRKKSFTLGVRSTMAEGKLYNTAKLIGYNQFDDIVYAERLSLYDYYDGLHVWDSSEGVLKLRMVKMVGTLYDARGMITQEFETAFSPDTGVGIGSRATHEDGTTLADGVYADT
jgi:hypothetical protein